MSFNMMTLWLLTLMFVATIYNVVTAYNAMGAINVQDKFQEIGLLYSEQAPYPLPTKKSVQIFAHLE